MAEELAAAEAARDLAKCRADEVLAVAIARTSNLILRQQLHGTIKAKESVYLIKQLAYARNNLNSRLVHQIDRDEQPPSPAALTPGSSADVLAQLRRERHSGTESGSESTPGTPVSDTG